MRCSSLQFLSFHITSGSVWSVVECWPCGWPGQALSFGWLAHHGTLHGEAVGKLGLTEVFGLVAQSFVLEETELSFLFPFVCFASFLWLWFVVDFENSLYERLWQVRVRYERWGWVMLAGCG